MISGRRTLGRAGEDAAARHLEAAGYPVIARGFRARRGEIDLVCRAGRRILVVEVKTRSSAGYGLPEEAVDDAKRAAMQAAASEYRALSGWRGDIGYAIVAVEPDAGGRLRVAGVTIDPF